MQPTITNNVVFNVVVNVCNQLSDTVTRNIPTFMLEDKNKKITLDSDGLEVPKWSWKVVKDENSNSAMAFVTLNNPFASSITNICSDLCDDFGWDWKDRKVFMKGYTICCATDDLRNVIDFIPSEAIAKNVLQK